MPRIARKRVSVFEPASMRFFGILIGSAGIVILGALFLGFSDRGMIDVNTKITSTDQSGFVNRVNQVNVTNDVNGGLRPAALDTAEPLAPEAPAPTTPTGTPEVSGASTTEATTTDEVMSDSDAQSPEPTPTSEMTE